jgi:serine/threonine-protein kinase
MTPQEGSTFGPYRLLRRLGGGGVGEVFQAEGVAAQSTGLPERVALKVISGSASDSTVQNIAREAKAAGDLHQPHIIPFYGVLAHEGRLATVMALAQGGSLGDGLRPRVPSGQPALTLPLSGAIVARLVSQIGAALEAAHAAGMVHGDVKPNNVFVRTSPSGRPLAAISDFGQSVLIGTGAAILSRAGTTDAFDDRSDWAARQLVFAAPEQLDGIFVPASDQYQLAALAYLLLTGTPPIVAGSNTMIHMIKESSARLPSLVNTGLPATVDAALLRALAKDPGGRFPSLALFVEALRNSLASQNAGRVTNQFAELAGMPVSSYPPNPATLAPAGAPVATSAGAYSRVPDPPPTINKRLAIITSAALLLSILACVLASQAFSATSFLPHIVLGNQPGGTVNAKVPTANATAAAQASAAVSELRLVTQQTPVFEDKLTSNRYNWQTNDKTLFFASDGFHISTFTATSTVGSADTPWSHHYLPGLGIEVDTRFTQGQPGNFAGLRFFVSQNSDGTENYYCFLTSIEGRFAVWHHQSDVATPWTFIASGYTSALTTGLDQSNVLDVLALGSGRHQEALLFANDRFIAQIPVSVGSAAAVGGSGLIVFNDDTEVVFSNLAIYDASKVAGI